MNRLWRTAGALCIAHVALLFGGYAQMRSAGFGASPTDIVSSYQQAVPTRMYAGGLLAILAMLVLLATVTLFGRLLRGTTETSRWFASLVTTAGAVAITVTLAGAMPAPAPRTSPPPTDTTRTWSRACTRPASTPTSSR